MTEALFTRLHTPVVTGRRIAEVERHNGSWRIGLCDGTTTAANNVVFTTPLTRRRGILGAVDRELSAELAAIPYAGLAVVALAYPAASLPRPLDGYGYLVTRAERLSTVGVLWESSIFPGRAPDDAVLLRVFLGGPCNPA